MLSWLHHLRKILISSETNIRWLKKKLEMNKFVLKLRHDIKIYNAKGTVHGPQYGATAVEPDHSESIF
jgi:hypothetical protein